MGIRFVLLFACLFGSGVLFSGCEGPDSSPNEAGNAQDGIPSSAKIALIVPAGDDAYTRALRDGLTIGADEFELPCEWYTTSLDAGAHPAEMLKAAVHDKVRAIVIGPDGIASLMTELQDAAAKGTPLVVVGEAAEIQVPLVSLVATDHFHTGRLLAQFLADRLDSDAEVLLVNRDGDEASAARLRGFEYAAVHELGKLIPVVAERDAEIPADLREVLKQYDDVQAIVALNTASTLAAIEVVSGPKEQPIVCGYGVWNDAAAAIRGGRLAVTVVEDPYTMGYSAMMSLARHFREGDNFEYEYIVPQSVLVTNENLASDNIKRLLESNMREDLGSGSN